MTSWPLVLEAHFRLAVKVEQHALVAVMGVGHVLGAAAEVVHVLEEAVGVLNDEAELVAVEAVASHATFLATVAHTDHCHLKIQQPVAWVLEVWTEA